MKVSPKQLALSLLRPNLILAAIVLLFLFTASHYESTIKDGDETIFVHRYGWGGWQLYWRPLLFLISLVALLFAKPWSRLLAAFSSAMIVYLVGWLAWSGVSKGEGVPMFSKDMFVAWCGMVAKYEPQEFIELALAAAVFGYSVVSLVRHRMRKDASLP